jgi:hypothetical protein
MKAVPGAIYQKDDPPAEVLMKCLSFIEDNEPYAIVSKFLMLDDYLSAREKTLTPQNMTTPDAQVIYYARTAWLIEAEMLVKMTGQYLHLVAPQFHYFGVDDNGDWGFWPLTEFKIS